jgi:tetratricopeptide (TPR) repeat protein
MPAQAAASTDLSRAEELVRNKKYQEAHDLLTSLEASMSGSPEWNYLAGRATLGLGQTVQAKAFFERSLELKPNSAASHLGLGRAYAALGEYAQAQIEFETVLRFGSLPPDLLTDVQIYDKAAEQYLENNRLVVGFAFAEAGAGYYWEHRTFHPSSLSDSLRQDPFYHVRGGTSVDYLFSDSYAVDGNVDYRFRHYFNDLVRNDSDLRWFGQISHTHGESNLSLGSRGRVSYRGNGQYRNDYGIIGTVLHRFNSSNQLGFEAEVRRRAYPPGPLRERSRSTAEGTLRWMHALADRANFTVTANGASEFNSERPDGHANIWGATGSVNYTFTSRLGGFLTGVYAHHNFDENRTHFDRSLVEIGIFSRTDNNYELGDGLAFDLKHGWSLRPDFLYTREVSSTPVNDYHSTAVRLSVRKDFF